MASLDLQADPREIITRMWPEHAKHLSPAGNTMGGGKIDPDEGVVCNCGQVLGYPTVQDEADYVAAEPDQPDTSGTQTGEPDDEPDWTPQLTEREHAPDPDSYQDPDLLEDLEGQSAPGPLAQSVQDKANTVDAIWNHPDTQAVVNEALRDSEMRDRFERNPHDAEARAYVHGQRDLTEPDNDYAAAAPGFGDPGWRDPTADEAQAGDGSARYYGPSGEPNEIPPDIQGQPSQFADDTLSEARQRMTTDYGEPDGPPKGVMPWRDQGVVPAEDPIAARVVTIDPTTPYGPQDVEHQLLDIAGRIERGVHFQRYWEEREFAAESIYTDKSARSRYEHRNDGAKDIRDAVVQMECKEEWRELLLCRAMVKAMRETMHNLRSLQSGYQTVARSVSESTRNPAGSRGRP